LNAGKASRTAFSTAPSGSASGSGARTARSPAGGDQVHEGGRDDRNLARHVDEDCAVSSPHCETPRLLRDLQGQQLVGILLDGPLGSQESCCNGLDQNHVLCRGLVHFVCWDEFRVVRGPDELILTPEDFQEIKFVFHGLLLRNKKSPAIDGAEGHLRIRSAAQLRASSVEGH
jgi:hypothetical protein